MSASDKHGKRRIVVSLRINEEAAKVLPKGNNRTQVLAELDARMKKLSPEMQEQITAEFEKLMDLGYFVAVTKLSEHEQEELRNSPVLFYLSLASSFKSDSLSNKFRCNLNT